MPLPDGATFAGYTIVRLLGVGGMGEVYLARHPRLPREDALKILSASVSADTEYRQRFEREADVVAALWHPNIVAVHDRGESDGQLWIAMDYVDGTDAGELLAGHPGGLPTEQVMRIVLAVAEALDYAHGRHLLHRDVKPSNILVARDELDDQRIMLADFGIARRDDDNDGLTGTNMTVGTVAYAAPEQLMGKPLDGAADQYALAATAFHLLTGAPPFQHSNPAVVISQHLTAAPPKLSHRRPDLAQLDPALSKALSKDPAQRYARCVDFARALTHGVGAGDTVDDTRLSMASSDSVPVRHERTGGRRPAILIAAVLAVLLVVTIAFAVGQFAGDREAGTHTAAPTTTTTTTTSSIPASTAASAPPAVVTDTVTDVQTDTETAATTAPAPAPAVSTVAIGAACDTVGATGSTADGATAYCETLQYTDRQLWSLNAGEIPNPVVTSSPTAAPPYEDESPVQICMQQTGHSRLRCAREVRRGTAG